MPNSDRLIINSGIGWYEQLSAIPLSKWCFHFHLPKSWKIKKSFGVRKCTLLNIVILRRNLEKDEKLVSFHLHLKAWLPNYDDAMPGLLEEASSSVATTLRGRAVELAPSRAWNATEEAAARRQFAEWSSVVLLLSSLLSQFFILM